MSGANVCAGKHNPIVSLDGVAALKICNRSPEVGDVLTFDASGSSDPDHHHLSFKWSVLRGAGSYQKEIRIDGDTQLVASFYKPMDSAEKEVHMICEATDGGVPRLIGYHRIIIRPFE